MNARRWTVMLFGVALARSISAAPAPAGALVEAGAFPTRVHVVEDYETDIEKRWWLRGTVESRTAEEGGGRVCRAADSADFDDKMGDPRARYKAVVFNPVPGPPMGQRTRLSFRYHLSETDRLRVQICSLSNGYHRRIDLTGMQQGRWASATVDMTRLRRPDGSGGPLAADERIDDIQFYTDAAASLMIDDIVLYDAAGEGEKRPFPRRAIFTGWFDTGRQGKDREWPGEFEITPHEPPRTWKAARSVASAGADKTWVRIHMRGRRALGRGKTEVFFRYRAKAERLLVELSDTESGKTETVAVKGMRAAEWTEATAGFSEMREADEVRFIVPAGAEVVVDDVLVYEP